MGALRQAWATIAKQLSQLTGKDRALIGSLVIVGVLALILVALWSSKPTQVPLLPDMGPGDQSSAATALSEADIEHTVKGGKVYVAPDKRLYALAYLQQSNKLPQDTQTLFASLSKGLNWMSSRADSDRLANAALCDVLSGVIANFKGVEAATVMIDAPESLGMGGAFRKPTASVGVMLKAGKSMDRDMVDAIAAMVSGAKAGLSMADVKVIDQRRGEQHSPRVSNTLGGGSNLGSSGTYLELIAGLEERIHGKIAEQIRIRDPFSLVTVTLQADNTITRTTTETFMPDGKGSAGVLESTTSEESSDRSSGGGGGAAPGITSNLPSDINTGSGSSGSGTSTTKSTTTDKFKTGLGNKKVEQLAPGGMPTRVSVMVSLSREYIVNLVKTKKGAVAAAAGTDTKPDEPTQKEIDDTFDAEKLRMKADLEPLIQAASVEAQASNIPRVTISLIPVAQMGMAGLGGGVPGANMASFGGSGAVGGVMGQLTSGPMIRTAFLGGLAVVALGMMLMLVRKSSKPQNLPSPEELAGLPPVIDAGDDVVGEADEGATAMVGIELGEQQIKTKKMLESIEELVKKNPTDGANLMNRWLNVER